MKTIFLILLFIKLFACAQEHESYQESPPDHKIPSPSSSSSSASVSLLPPIKILSLDGGGIRGIIPATLLAGIENQTGKKTYELFDLIAGTSTGGLIALIATTPNAQKNNALMSAEQIAKFYEDNAAKIFKSSCLLGVPRLACGMAGPLYEASAFEDVVKSLVGNRLFKDSLKPVLITTFDIEKKQGFGLESNSPQCDELSKAEVARATSAAPTYFAPKKIKLKKEQGGYDISYMVDGGLYKNNPALLAYRRAINIFGRDAVKKRGVILISLGTGWPVQNISDGQKLMTAGYNIWAPTAVDAIIDGSSNEDHEFITSLLDSNKISRYIRIQTALNNIDYPDIIEMDNIKSQNIRNLKNAALAIVKYASEFQEIIRLLKN